MITNVNKTSSFANWLLQVLAEKGWSQADLARKANISRTAISNVLSGERSPGPDFCRAVARALHIPQYTVFYIAGLLEELPPELRNLPDTDQQILALFQQLPPEEKEDILAFLRRRAQRNQKTAPAKGGKHAPEIP